MRREAGSLLQPGKRPLSHIQFPEKDWGKRLKSNRLTLLFMTLFNPSVVTMEKHVNPTIEYFRTIGFVLLLVYLFLGLFAFISGHIVGFSPAVWCCVGLGIMVTIVFMSIVLFNITWIGVLKIIIKRLSKLL
jgi:hypothetical protein